MCVNLFRLILLYIASTIIYIRLGDSQLKIDIKMNNCCQFLKSSPSIIKLQQKQPFPHFVLLKVGLLVKKLEKHKHLFKLDDCLLLSIDIYLTNALPSVFEVWKIPYFSCTYGNTFELLGL